MWQGVQVTEASSSRRIGSSDSKTRAQLVDAAERLMLEEGYAAVTSRRVAAKAGLKPQLVHYYFRTMDDLYIEVFRRRAERDLARAERALADNNSLQTLWAMNTDPRGAAFIIEFAALANHRKPIRAEIARYAERFRQVQLGAFTAALDAAGVTEREVPPIAALLLMTGIGQILALERGLGFTTGHDEAVAYIEKAVRGLDKRGRR